MMIYVGIDDTDTIETRGTGALARAVAADLARDYAVMGVVRQQLLRHPRVPCTKNNSSKGLMMEVPGGERGGAEVAALATRVRALMMDDFIPGSDPGLCVAAHAPEEVLEWGRRAQRELLTKAEAEALAVRHGIHLEELGGDGMGIIGALAAVGLTAGGEAGRYIQVGGVRSLVGLQPVEAVLAAGVAAVETAEGETVAAGMVQTDCLRPARRRGRPVAVVGLMDGVWVPVKLD